MYQSQQHIVDDFTDSLGLPRFDPASAEPHVLCIDHRWPIQISCDGHRLVLAASAGPLPVGGITPSPAAAMTGTISWTRLHDTDAHTVTHLGREPLHDLVILHASKESIYLDRARFRQWVQEFITQLTQWGSLISQQEHIFRSNEQDSLRNRAAASTAICLPDLIQLA